MSHARALLLGAGLALACGASVAVQSHPQPDFAPAVLVGSPPPPAQIEVLSEQQPSPGCRWVDGQWRWTSEHWDWRPGGWVQPPEGCQYSQPSITWAASPGAGGLYYRAGRWYSVSEPENLLGSSAVYGHGSSQSSRGRSFPLILPS